MDYTTLNTAIIINLPQPGSISGDFHLSYFCIYIQTLFSFVYFQCTVPLKRVTVNRVVYIPGGNHSTINQEAVFDPRLQVTVS